MQWCLRRRVFVVDNALPISHPKRPLNTTTAIRAIAKTTAPNAGAVAAMSRISGGNIASNQEKKRHIIAHDLPKRSLRVLRQRSDIHGLLSRPVDKAFQFPSSEEPVNQSSGVPTAEATRSPPQRRTSPPTLIRRSGTPPRPRSREALHRRKFREPVDARPKAANQQKPYDPYSLIDDKWRAPFAGYLPPPGFNPQLLRSPPLWEASPQVATAASYIRPKSDGTIGVHRSMKRSRVTHTISEDCSDERVLHKRRLVALRGTARGIIPKKVDNQGPGPAQSTANNDFANTLEYPPPPLPAPIFVPTNGPLDPNIDILDPHINLRHINRGSGRQPPGLERLARAEGDAQRAENMGATSVPDENFDEEGYFRRTPTVSDAELEAELEREFEQSQQEERNGRGAGEGSLSPSPEPMLTFSESQERIGRERQKRKQWQATRRGTYFPPIPGEVSRMGGLVENGLRRGSLRADYDGADRSRYI